MHVAGVTDRSLAIAINILMIEKEQTISLYMTVTTLVRE
jgi:hypothetical protein